MAWETRSRPDLCSQNKARHFARVSPLEPVVWFMRAEPLHLLCGRWDLNPGYWLGKPKSYQARLHPLFRSVGITAREARLIPGVGLIRAGGAEPTALIMRPPGFSNSFPLTLFAALVEKSVRLFR